MVMRGVVLTLALFIGGKPSTWVEDALAPAKVSFYDVEGNSPEELRREMDLKGPKDDLGRTRDAFTRWKISWSWPTEDGEPKIKEVEIKTDITVLLPRPASNLTKDVKIKWDNYIRAIIHHESKHVRIAADNAYLVRKEILKTLKSDPNLSYAGANRVGKEVLSKIRSLDTSLDKETNSGKEEGVIWPPQ